MRETERNIRRYRKQLIHTKEKVITSIMLFVMSAVMLTTASLAWIVLSVSPEVSNITTTVAGNGNLEIALASGLVGEVQKPEESKVGDGQLTNLAEKNKTWGNLINLNSDSYGLHVIDLKPALINSSGLNSKPLSVAKYSADGRVEKKESDLGYANYDSATQLFTNIGESAQYGVRAIASKVYEQSGAEIEERIKVYTDLQDEITEIQNQYGNIVNNQSYIDSLTTLMSTVLNDGLNGTDTPLEKDSVVCLYNMFVEFSECIDSVGAFYTKIVALQNPNINLNDYKSEEELSKVGIVCDGYDKYYEIKTNYPSKLAIMESVRDKAVKGEEPVLMNDLYGPVDYLIAIDDVVIDGKKSVSELMADKSEAISIVGGYVFGGTASAQIPEKGAITRFEQIINNTMSANVKIPVKYSSFDFNLKAKITTVAPKTGILQNMWNTTLLNALLGGVELKATAGEVYGLAIDVWLRTNAQDSYLILEGQAQTEERLLKNADGHVCYVVGDEKYYYKLTSGVKYPIDIDSVDVTQLPSDEIKDFLSNPENGMFFVYATGQSVEMIDTELTEFVNNADFRYATATYVIGYDGVNRVWQESTNANEGLLGTSTTQGEGSCYIFYPSNPIEQNQMLKLLDALNVVFIDQDGTKLATAKLDTNLAYEEVGKVTVPLVLSEDDSLLVNLGTEENPNNVNTITELTKNQETLITAIVYLNGEQISNTDVNSNTNIEGFLNLQFGSTTELNSLKDERLQNEYIYVTGKASRTEWVFDPEGDNSSEIEFTIGGKDNIQNVTAQFVRRINSSQGTLSELITLQPNGDTWKGTVTFDRPGTYILRGATVDGVEYEFDNNQVITIEVTGFDISRVSWNMNSNNEYYMTSDNEHNVELRLELGSSLAYKPASINGLFRNDDTNEYVYAKFTETDGVWKANAKFTTSGTFTLESIEVDNEVYASPNTLVLTVYLGVYADIDLGDPDDYTFTHDPEISSQTGEISLKIFDNKGNRLENLNNVRVIFSKGIKEEDKLMYSEYISVVDAKRLSNGKIDQNSIDGIYDGQYSFTDQREIGRYTFESLTVDGYRITKVVGDNLIVYKSPNPPEYLSTTADIYQYAPELDASFVVDIMDSSAAKVVAVMERSKSESDSNEETYFVEGTLQETNDDFVYKDETRPLSTWNFVIGNDIYNGMTSDQTGYWKLKEIRITDVNIGGDDYSYSGDSVDWTTEGKYYTLAKPNKQSTVLSDLVLKSTTANKDLNTYPFGVDGVYFSETVDVAKTDSIEAILTTDLLDSSELSKYFEITNISLDMSVNVVDWWKNYDEAYKATYDSSKTFSAMKNDEKAKIITAASGEGNTYAASFAYYYGGTYTPIWTIEYNTVTDIDEQGNKTISNFKTTIKFNENKNTSNELVKPSIVTIQNSLASQVIAKWIRPEVAWADVFPKGTLYTKGYEKTEGSGCSTKTYYYASLEITNEIDTSNNNIDVYVYLDGWTSLSYRQQTGITSGYVDLMPSYASARISKAGTIKQALVVVEDSGENQSLNVSLTFTSNDSTYTMPNPKNNTTSSSGTTYHGLGYGTSQYHSHGAFGQNSKGRTVEITLEDNSVYVFELEKPLSVNANNSTGW